MDRESVERLRFDSRLKNRANWVDSATQDAYVEALPDVAEKMTTCGDEDDAAEAAAEAASAASPRPTPDFQPESTTPVAGDFSSSYSTSTAPPAPASSVSSAPPEPATPPDQGSAGTFPGETSGGAGSFGRDPESD